MPTLPLATMGDREVLLGSVSLNAPRQAAEAVEPALVATLAETAGTSTSAVTITRYGGGRRLEQQPPRRLSSSLVEYSIAVRMASAPDVLETLDRVPEGKLTQTLKRKITELDLEEDFRANGGNKNSLALKQRSIAKAPSVGDGPPPPDFGGDVSEEPNGSTDENATEWTLWDYSFYLSGAGVVLLCMCAMFFTQSKEKRTEVVDISEMEEAKPERSSKAKGTESYDNLGELEEKPRKADGKARRAKSEASRRPPDEMSDIAAASTTASSDSGRRYSDASSAATLPPNALPNRSAVRGEAPGQLPRRGKTEGSRGEAGPPVQRRYTTDVDAGRRAADGKALRKSATGSYQPPLDGARAPPRGGRGGRGAPAA